jgi:small-conductance mechanosensitive channel
MGLRRLGKLALKLSPFLVVAVLLLLAGSTNLFSPQLERDLLAQAKEELVESRPILISLAIAFTIFYAGYLIYRPLRCGFEKALTKFGKGFSDRGRRLWSLSFQTAFWLLVIGASMKVVAPNFINNLVVGGGFVAGAAIVAVDSVKNAISSVFLHTLPKCKETDYVKVIGVDSAEGVIEKIDYLYTTIQPEDPGQKVVLPNSTVLNSSLIIGKATLPVQKKEPVVIRVECRCPNCGHTNVVTADPSKPPAQP